MILLFCHIFDFFFFSDPNISFLVGLDKYLNEMKIGLYRIIDKYKWISVTKKSRGVVFSLYFKKEEIGWLLEQMKKACELESSLGSSEEKQGHIFWRYVLIAEEGSSSCRSL